MLSLRRNLNTWPAKLFFLLLIGVFVTWGVGDVIRNIAVDTSVASVAGRHIELPEAQEAYRRQLQQVTRMLGGKIEPTEDMRRSVASQAVGQLITQYAVSDAISRMGLAVPENALRQAVFAMPAFRDKDGNFDHAQLQSVLNNNNLTEARFLGLVSADLGQQQLMEAARAGVVSPDSFTREAYAFQNEKRIADVVDLPFSDAAAPAPPTDQQLSLWYDNHKELYSSPEYRHIKAVVLAPQTVAKEVQVSDDEIKAAYDAASRRVCPQPEKRTVQVILTPDEAKAQALAEKWTAGADWATMEKEPGATAVELTDATKSEIPGPRTGRRPRSPRPRTRCRSQCTARSAGTCSR